MNELDRQEGRAVLCFGYEPSRLLAGKKTRDAIRRVSQRLLDDLTGHRASGDKVSTGLRVRLDESQKLIDATSLDPSCLLLMILVES